MTALAALVLVDRCKLDLDTTGPLGMVKEFADLGPRSQAVFRRRLRAWSRQATTQKRIATPSSKQ